MAVRPKILLVDDEPEATELMSLMLALEDKYDVMTINDPRKAFEKLKGEKFDILVTDINMIEMSGLEMIQKVRKLEFAKDIKIMVISAKDFSAEDYKLLRGHNVRLLRKPFLMSDLFQNIREI